ncbi:TetR/AcrR family transcriptional regulator [Kribbella turkmenica]|uniref:TetR/AcrR family transcriptional regulator n=1 Tax=Kribbella turkmenica TaxID=2530375 RepID=A0A4R4WRX2_9ACTN|nr:TetR/AcrR family transcriptional regulator [Kribbella turkmenica]TDD19430.1 TetR/AcrR family transcriptional regulator [Kribbella turkmenica]
MGERGTGGRARPGRAALSRERVVQAALALADEKGVVGLSMRAIAARLGVEAMSLYNHVTNREDILDRLVDAVFAEIELPVPDADWKDAMRDRAASARRALRRHPWAVGLMDSRSRPGAAVLRHHDAVLGSLRAGGFSVAMAAHAFSLIDSYVYGFVLQELSLPFTNRAELDAIVGDLLNVLGDDHPHLAEMTQHVLRPAYDYGDEFEFGLCVVLDGLHPDEDHAAAS